jgi:hypothetical protein
MAPRVKKESVTWLYDQLYAEWERARSERSSVTTQAATMGAFVGVLLGLVAQGVRDSVLDGAPRTLLAVAAILLFAALLVIGFALWERGGSDRMSSSEVRNYQTDTFAKTSIIQLQRDAGHGIAKAIVGLDKDSDRRSQHLRRAVLLVALALLAITLAIANQGLADDGEDPGRPRRDRALRGAESTAWRGPDRAGVRQQWTGVEQRGGGRATSAA